MRSTKMPKKKNNENENPIANSKNISIKPNKIKKQKMQPNTPVFKFDMSKILKERQADAVLREKNAEMDKQMKVVDDLFQKEINEINTIKQDNNKTMFSQKLDYVIFDCSKYNINSNSNLNLTTTNFYLHQLLQMSIEQNKLEAHIIYNSLINENVSLVLDDVNVILINWGADLNSLTSKLPIKCQINDYGKIGRHNFELVLNYISHNILKNEGFKNSDLLTLAKIAVTISLDYHCGQMIYVIKNLFSTCINKAFNEDNDTDIISFAQELYSSYKKSDLLNIVIDLFLPLNSPVQKKICSYLTFKLYKSFLGQTNNINPYPNDINDWFVQDIVNKNYFKSNPRKLLERVIQLLEHVVVTFDLYKNEEKLSDMYYFLNSLARTNELFQSLKLINILDQWELQLFRLYVNRTIA